MATEQTPRENILAAAQSLGLTIESKFMPWSQSRNKSEKQPSLNWIVTLKRNGKEILTTDYGAGCGHCPSYKQGAYDRDTDARAMVTYECETGRKAWKVFYTGREKQVVARPGSRGENHILPDMVDILASLSMDSSVLDAGGFESWASDYGYDKYSRKAESTYQACLDIALKLRAAIGEDGLESLRNACQEY